MTERIKYSTAYIHEFAAKIEEMALSGYRVDHTSAFCARRRGSAYEIHFIPTREVVDFDDYFPWTEEEEQALTKLYEEMAEKRVAKSSETGKSILDSAFANLDNDEDCNHIDRKAVEELNRQLSITQKWEVEDNIQELLGMLKYGADNPDIKFSGVVEMTDKKGMKARVPGIIGCKVINGIMSDMNEGKIEPLPKELFDRIQDLRDKAEANREREEALNELAAQSQELGMYDVDNGIFDRLVENIESAQSNPEGCGTTIVEVDKERVKVYSKSELDELYWTDLQEVGYKFGVKGRNRNKLTKAILEAQEKNELE